MKSIRLNIIKTKINGVRSQKFAQFMLFVFVSFIFWFALTLNEDFKYDVAIPLHISNIPDSVTLITDAPKEINVNLNAKGYYFVKHKFTSKQPLNINFAKYNNANCIKLGATDFNDYITNSFGPNSQAIAYSPDSIKIYYTTLPGKAVKLKLNVNASPDNQHIIKDNITSDYEYITLYSLNHISTELNTIETSPIKCQNLKQTTTIKTKVDVPWGMRAVPDSVEITIPVEPLLAKSRTINIEVVNTPAEKRLIVFPSQVEIKYLIPKSLFNHDSFKVKAVVDYNDIYLNGNKLPVQLSDIPENYRSIIASIDSVEYIIEQ